MRHTLQTVALSSLLCLGLGSGAMLAQDAATPSTTQDNAGPQNMHRMRGPMSTEEQLAHMTKELNLTSEQQTQIKPLLDGRREQMMQVHQDQSMSRDDKMAKMKTLDDDTHAKIAAVLNDQQKAKFQQMAEKREQHWNNGQGQGQPQQ
jgi:Spy/CpxP family protein refolding chaperone